MAIGSAIDIGMAGQGRPRMRPDGEGVLRSPGYESWVGFCGSEGNRVLHRSSLHGTWEASSMVRGLRLNATRQVSDGEQYQPGDRADEIDVMTGAVRETPSHRREQTERLGKMSEYHNHQAKSAK
jgi:hypothetical protein